MMAAMIAQGEQFSMLLVEKDAQDECLATWNFPSVPQLLQDLICLHCESRGENESFYFKLKNEFIYVRGRPVSYVDNEIDANTVYVAIVSKSYYPQKYLSILDAFSTLYLSVPGGEPTKLAEGYLSLITKGSFAGINLDQYTESEHQIYMNNSIMKELVLDFGVDFIVLYNALLLKKRVLVIGDNHTSLEAFCRTLPQFLKHRKDWSCLRPLIIDSPAHIQDLTSAGLWIAGTMTQSIATKAEQLQYDVVVSLAEKRITVSTHSQKEMKMCSVHKDLSTTVLGLAESEEGSSSDEIVAVIAEKTEKVLSQLKTLVGENGGTLTMQLLQEKVSNEKTQQWLVAVAIAEGLM